MNKADLLFFNSNSGKTVDLIVYHVVIKKAICVCGNGGKITPISVVSLSRQISEFTSTEISRILKLEYLQNNLFLEQIFAELKKVQQPVPKRVLDDCHQVITKAKEAQLVESLALNEHFLIFFLYSPRRGGDQRIRVYHTELKKAVTISNNKNISIISTSSLYFEIKKGATEIMEVHDVEEYLINKDLMTKILSSLKNQLYEPSSLGSFEEKEFHDLVLRIKNDSLAELSFENEE